MKKFTPVLFFCLKNCLKISSWVIFSLKKYLNRISSFVLSDLNVSSDLSADIIWHTAVACSWADGPERCRYGGLLITPRPLAQAWASLLPQLLFALRMKWKALWWLVDLVTQSVNARLEWLVHFFFFHSNAIMSSTDFKTGAFTAA